MSLFLVLHILNAGIYLLHKGWCRQTCKKTDTHDRKLKKSSNHTEPQSLGKSNNTSCRSHRKYRLRQKPMPLIEEETWVIGVESFISLKWAREPYLHICKNRSYNKSNAVAVIGHANMTDSGLRIAWYVYYLQRRLRRTQVVWYKLARRLMAGTVCEYALVGKRCSKWSTALNISIRRKWIWYESLRSNDRRSVNDNILDEMHLT